MGNLDGKHYEDVYVVNPATGERTIALRKAQHVMAESPDGTKFLYYEDGAFSSFDMETRKSSNLTAQDSRQILRPR
jgi:hypothetical protein